MDPALRLRPGQRILSPAQEAEAQRFAAERIAAHLATAPVDEGEAESFLRQAYAAAGLPAPQHIRWVDGPLPLVEALEPARAEVDVWEKVGVSVRAGAEARIRARIRASVDASIGDRIGDRVWAAVGASIWQSLGSRLSD